MTIDAILTNPALAGMRAVNQWIVYALTASKTRPGKTDKTPLHHATGRPTGVNDPASWTDPHTAAAAARRLGPPHGIGFCFTEAAGWWFVDIDECHDGSTWSPLAQQACLLFAGAAVEVSASGRGLHLFGRGAVPPHACKNIEHGAELYHADRFAALSGTSLSGDCMSDHADAVAWWASTYFPPRVGAVNVSDDGPCAEWSGPADDDALLAIAMRSRSAAGVFGGGVTFAQLWNADADALGRKWPADGRVFDASNADMALAQHLAYFTGRDAERVDRLMRRSGLARDKYDRPDYLPRTIVTACAQQRDVYRGGAGEAAAPSAAGARYELIADDPFNGARALIQRRYTHAEGACLVAWQDGFYRWDASRWVEMTTADIRAQLYDFLDREGMLDYRPNQSKVSNLLDALKAAAHLESTHAPPCWIAGAESAPPSELVACANGMLHLPSRAMLHATPRLFNLNAVPFNYEPNAPAPTQWLKFLHNVWPDDPEAIATLQEIFGYSLTPDTSQQKIFLIIGPKRSGKGTIARVLAEMLGSANVAGPSLASMAGDFGLQPLIGKQIAIVSDARLGGRTDPKQVAENLLRVSGEDRVDVARKGTTSLSLKLSVRFVLLTNELPRIADASGAMASRFVILTMTESFIGREDPGLTSKLLRELPGVFAWAVDGWHRLNARGHFVEPKSSAGAAQELADLGSPIGAFVRDECWCGEAAEVEGVKLFDAWRTWCARQGMAHAGTVQTFGRDLGAAYPAIKRGQRREGKERSRIYRGIALTGTHWHASYSIPGGAAVVPQ